MDKDFDNTQMWVSVHECVGIPGFPTGVSNVRNKLEKLAEGLDNVRRKRAGSKAWEYHVSILPEMARQYLGVVSVEHNRTAEDQKQPDDCRNLWELIYSSLTKNQREAVVDVFITGGLKQLMPDVIELSNMETSERKEILLRRNSSGEAPSAPSLSTRSKKAG
ncbi:DNA-binding protein [Kluyvera georgiana]|uniref:DNA-binding protein n=1 Tax=Kluyvera georgiana TaxID=73098 RepID=UPI003F66EA57